MRLVDREAVIDKQVYTATNPVQDHLVDRVQIIALADKRSKPSEPC